MNLRPESVVKTLNPMQKNLILPRVRLATGANDYRLFSVSTKIEEQFLNAVLLAGLSLVIRWPILLVGDLFRERDALRFGDHAIGSDFAFHHEFHRINVFALVTALNVVGACASLLRRVNMVDVRPRLRRDEPLAVNLVQLAKCCDYESAFFSPILVRVNGPSRFDE